MAIGTPITEQFQHFVRDLKESFWGDVYGKTWLAWERFWEEESRRERDRYVATGQFLHTLTGHTSTVWSLAFSADGKYLASGDQDASIRIWEVRSGREVDILKGHSEAVTTVAFSPDGHYLASGSFDRTVKLWRRED